MVDFDSIQKREMQAMTDTPPEMAEMVRERMMALSGAVG
jgi:hypothetical protein